LNQSERIITVADEKHVEIVLDDELLSLLGRNARRHSTTARNPSKYRMESSAFVQVLQHGFDVQTDAINA
jgi:hypothetical protein